MTRLLALLRSLLAPLSNRAFVGAALDGFAAWVFATTPVAVARIAVGRRDAAHVLRSLVAQRYDRRIAGSAELALYAVAAAPRIVPQPVRAAGGAVRTAGLAIIDQVEVRFIGRWPAPGQARLAAGLFTTALTLSCAGVVGAVSSVNPVPMLQAPAHASVEQASGPLEAAANAPVDGPAPASPDVAAPSAAAPAAAPQAAAPAAAVSPSSPVLPGEGRGALPIGKGMWIWLHDRAEGGDPNAIVARAKTWGFTHIYVRTGTLKEGFIGGPFLDRLLPVAHANGIRVYGWDFPYMNHPGQDVERALAAIRHTTPDGHRIDGFAPDIETSAEGTNENPEFIRAYTQWLRDNVGADYPLIAVIPNPTAYRIASGYPFADIVRHFDAIAPMVYWMNREPGSDVAHAMTYLAQFNKPVFPIGQAYDGGIDGGPAGIPNRGALIRFMQVADEMGAASVSFWSWQHASPEAWDAIGDAMEFRLGHGAPQALRPPMIRAYQLQLAYLGYPVAPTGQWSPEMTAALTAFQRDNKVAESGVVDLATREALLRPRLATVRPAGH